MARPLRLEFAGALYHVTSHGDGGQDVYLDDGDRLTFLDVLAAVCRRFNWRIYAYCLMTDRYHLLVETPDGNLSKGMRQLNGVYTQQINKDHDRAGPVFQGRFKSILVEKDVYLLDLSSDIVLDPVRSAMTRSARDWRWSSYRATTGEVSAPRWLQRDALLAGFADTEDEAVRRYRRFVSAGRDHHPHWYQVRRQVFLGSDVFVEEMLRKLSEQTSLEGALLAQRRRTAKPLEEYERECTGRDAAIAAAYASGGYSMQQVGDHFGLHLASISRIVRRQEVE